MTGRSDLPLIPAAKSHDNSELLIWRKNLIRGVQREVRLIECRAAGGAWHLVVPEGMQLEAAAQYYNSRWSTLRKSKSRLAFVARAGAWEDALPSR